MTICQGGCLVLGTATESGATEDGSLYTCFDLGQKLLAPTVHSDLSKKGYLHVNFGTVNYTDFENHSFFAIKIYLILSLAKWS